MPAEWFVGPLKSLKTLLGNVTAFRTFVGAADASQAMAAVYDYQIQDELFEVTGATSTTLVVAGENLTGQIATGSRVQVRGGLNAGYYRVTGVAYSGGNTTVTTSTAVPSTNVTDSVMQAQVMPCAVIRLGDGTTRTKQAVQSWTLDSSGSLELALFSETISTHFNRDTQLENRRASYLAFCSSVETIVDGIEALAGDGSLDVVGISVSESPVLIERVDNNDVPIWRCVLSLNTGG